MSTAAVNESAALGSLAVGTAMLAAVLLKPVTLRTSLDSSEPADPKQRGSGRRPRTPELKRSAGRERCHSRSGWGVPAPRSRVSTTSVARVAVSCSFLFCAASWMRA